MRAKVAWGRAAAGALGLALGCAGSDVFLCESDTGCQQSGVSGLCQPSGYCSFPDAACPSGQRYGGYADGPLAGACVEPGSPAGTASSDDGPSPLPPDTSTSTTGVTASTTAQPTTGLDGPVTTEPVDESDTGTGTSTGGMHDEAPATTDPPPQTVCWVDEFDDGMIDGATWCTYADPGVVVDEPLGHLRLALIPAEWVMGEDGSGWAATCEHVPLLGATATTEVLAVPQASPHTEAFIELRSDALGLGLGVLGGELYAFVWNGMGYAGVHYLPYDPAAHHFLRVVGTEEGLVAETSADGASWSHVYTEALDLAGSDGWAALGTWAESIPLEADETSFERFELCWLEG